MLTQKQLYWLNSRGGRTADDVLKDDYGFFVWMYGKDYCSVKVYLPV